MADDGSAGAGRDAGGAGWMAFPQALPARAVGELHEPAVRPARFGLSHNSVRNRDRLGRGLGQGFSQGYAGTAQLPARTDHGFYLRRLRRGVRLRGLDTALGALCGVDSARCMGRAPRTGPFRLAAGDRPYRHNFLAGRDKHRDGYRNAARGGHPVAVGELWRIITHRYDDYGWRAHQREQPPLFVLIAESVAASFRL